MRKVTASHFQHYVPDSRDGAELRSNVLPLGDFMRNHIVAEFRCRDELVVNLIDGDGQTVFLDSGRVVLLDGLYDGFKAIEVVSAVAFCYWIRAKGRWMEVPDPVPVAVKIDEPVNKPLADLVRAELQKYLARNEMDTALSTDVSVEELLEDIESGDLDFEDEPDPFGLGYEERLKEFQAAADAPPPAEPPKPAEAPAAAPSSPAAEPGDGSKTQIAT